MTAAVSMDIDYDASSPQVMLAYYTRLFPFKSLGNWLSHDIIPSRSFTHREFAFTLPGDVYLRYNSFDTADELKKQVCKYNPSRFEIGAVYTGRPRDKKTLRKLNPVLRELVFDIDMTDYDSIRTCCSGKGICKRCWGFISAAVVVLDHSLREEYGFQHLLWVYSGRRGIHCWISDKAALELTDDQRKALMGWLEVIKGGKDMVKKVNVRPRGSTTLHPALQKSLSALLDPFTELILNDQECFKSKAGWKLLLQLIPDKDIVESLEKAWLQDSSRPSLDKWDDLKEEARRHKKESSNRAAMHAAMEDIILQYTYPRLDTEVTKRRNHLLKSPFCVHPSTGRVCVPVDPKRVAEFDPEKVPTVGQLLKELDEIKGATKKDVDVKMEEDSELEHHRDWEQTSLKPYVDMFDAHIQGILAETRDDKRRAEMMKGVRGEW